MLKRLISPRTTRSIGLLDIGTSKTACFIVAPNEGRTGALRLDDPARVLGFGCKPSRGLKAGVVIDHDGAEQAVRAAVMQAEQAAGVTIDTVIVGVACGRLKSSTFAADTRVGRNAVGRAHIANLKAAGRKFAEREGSVLLHMDCLGYRLDGATLSDPLGKAGATLQADLHAVTVDDASLRSLLNVVERAGLTVGGIVPTPLASGLGATTEEERQLGSVCIDLGAGATTLSIFHAGRLLAADAVAVGGQHLTFDIARSLSTPFDQAERIKTLYGTLEDAESGDQEMVAYTLAGEEEPTLYQVAKPRIRAIVRSRMTDMLARIAERIERSGAGYLAAHRVVLTGGGSILPGLSSFAEELLNRPVRIGGPVAACGLRPDWCTPSFSAAAGLTRIAFDRTAGVRMTQLARIPDKRGTLGRFGQWLRKGL